MHINWTLIIDPSSDLKRTQELPPGSPTTKAIITGCTPTFWSTCENPVELPESAVVIESVGSSQEDVDKAKELGGVIVRYSSLPTPE